MINAFMIFYQSYNRFRLNIYVMFPFNCKKGYKQDAKDPERKLYVGSYATSNYQQWQNSPNSQIIRLQI